MVGYLCPHSDQDIARSEERVMLNPAPNVSICTHAWSTVLYSSSNEVNVLILSACTVAENLGELVKVLKISATPIILVSAPSQCSIAIALGHS